MSFNSVAELENKIADFFGAPHAVAVDCCTHGIELCLRLFDLDKINVPTRTYISIPFLAHKLNIGLQWEEQEWENYYYLTKDVVDAAVLWERNSYVTGTFMNISFQFQKHLSLGRGGMILTDDKDSAYELKRMSYDGRSPDIPWREQNISSIGYHYYMTPETAELGLDKFQNAVDTPPRKWTVSDWPDLTKMNVFNR